MTSSITSSVRSRLTEALMLASESPATTTMAARLNSHHATDTWKVESV